jgi:hypothetical protein
MAAGLVGLAIPAPAAAAPVLDANCPDGINTTTAAITRVAQTFTTQTTGSLVMGQVKVEKLGSPGDYLMEVNATDGSGTPTNTVLASTAIPDASVPANTSTITGLFATPAQVTAGQQYALVLRRPASDTLVAWIRNQNPCPGGTFFFSGSQTGGWGLIDDQHDMVSATFVEPAPPQADPEPEPVDSSPPNVQITSGPKDKTTKKTATFTFTGTDTRAIASFQCKLDARAFAPCTSPHTVRVKKGKHTFQAQAIDQAGNVGPPATDTWKVKRKRKRR